MTIELSPETQQLVERRMRQGGAPSPDEVVRVAMTLLDQRDSLGHVDDAGLERLYPGFREEIDRGMAEAEAGQLDDGEAFFAELEREDVAADVRSADRETA